MAEDRLRAAKSLIDQGRLLDARNILEGVPGDKAEDWRRKLDRRIGVSPTPVIASGPNIPMPPQPVFSGALTPAEVDQRNRLLSINDMTRAHAQTKSYTGAFVLVVALYFVLFIPGLIANWLFYSDGKRMQEIAGIPLPGVAPLLWLRNLMTALFALVVVLGGAVYIYYAVVMEQDRQQAEPVLVAYCQAKGANDCAGYARVAVNRSQQAGMDVKICMGSQGVNSQTVDEFERCLRIFDIPIVYK